jgi:hypothetical protein
MNRSAISVRDYLILRGLLTGILEDHLQGGLPVQETEELRAPAKGLTDEHYRWLMVLDLCASPAALRVGIEKRSPRDVPLVTLLGFFLTQSRQVDHDRFEWLLTYVLKRRLDAGEVQGAESVGAQILEMFPDLPQTPLSPRTQGHVDKLLAALEEINSFSSLLQLTSSGLVAKGRELKETFGEERHRPAVLAAVVRYNLGLGRAFRELFDKVADQNRELANQLATADYRGNVQPLHNLAAATEGGESAPLMRELVFDSPAITVSSPRLDAAPPLAPAAGEAGPGTLGAVSDSDPKVFTPAFQPDRDLVEKRRMRTALENLTGYFSAQDRPINSIPIQDSSLAFEEWEARALTIDYPAAERSFRAEFVRMLKDTSVLFYRIVEETAQLQRKASSQNLRAPHDESLAWLRIRGQEQIQTLRQFAEGIGKRGLPEKQQQILLTTLRLSDLLQGKRLRTTADPFGDRGDASLLTLPGDILSSKTQS